MKKYMVFKLISTHDIIGKVSAIRGETDIIKVEEPMMVFSTVLQTGSTVVLIRPYTTLCKDKYITIQKSHIIASYTPMDVMIKYYDSMVVYNRKHVEAELITGMKSATELISDVNDKGFGKSNMKDSRDSTFEEMLEYYSNLNIDKKTH